MPGGELGEVGNVLRQLAIEFAYLLLAPGRVIADRAQENVSGAECFIDAEAIFQTALTVVVIPLTGNGFSDLR